MMTGNDIKDFAKAGVLKQLKVDDIDLVNAINLASIELHKKFRLTVNEYYVLMKEGVTIYTLPEDCLQVLEIYNQEGELYTLNEEFDLNTISTVAYNQVQVGNPISGKYLSVIYQASPIIITSLDNTVSVPYTLLEPLLYYIGYVMYGSSSADLDGPASHHMQVFLDSCNRIKNDGLITQETEIKSTISAKGYI